jgi:hypothetical protein
MKVFTPELVAEVMAIPTWTAKRDFLRAVKSILTPIVSKLDVHIQAFEDLGRVASADEVNAILVQIMEVLAQQPDTDDYAAQEGEPA